MLKDALEPVGLAYSKAAGGWTLPLSADAAAKLAPVIDAVGKHFDTYSIKPSLTHPGITEAYLQAALTLPAVAGPEHTKLRTMADNLVNKGFSAEERDDLRTLSPDQREQSTSPRLAQLTPEMFELAAKTVTHVESVMHDNIQTRLEGLERAVSQDVSHDR